MYRTDLWDPDGRYGVVFAASGTDHGYVFQEQCNDPGRGSCTSDHQLGFVVSGISVVTSGALEALGEGISSFIISLLRYLVLIVPVVFIWKQNVRYYRCLGCVPGSRSADCAAAAGIFTARYRACLKNCEIFYIPDLLK